ncbi:hypothetical protein cypCar_00025027 [Cyprinus carpio]|nr:hypothetical protein cypCar_00025027 [Cyprinus carpio]
MIWSSTAIHPVSLSCSSAWKLIHLDQAFEKFDEIEQSLAENCSIVYEEPTSFGRGVLLLFLASDINI